MNRLFYPKLAAINIKNSSRAYIPYILTCIGTIAMFYNMCFLVNAKDIGSMSANQDLRAILTFGAYVIGIFSAIFLFYTNSFLIKRRKKEFGLFNILGMEKKHIARIMSLETLMIGGISLAVGLLTGILLSKLIILLLFKIISFKATFGFEVPSIALLKTLALFGGIFLVNLIYNILQVHVSKPVELLKGGNVGEKEPKTKWPITILGLICLGTGYYISLTTESPLAALNTFFIAVVLVMVGTYCLFTSGSIALLKLLRRNKGYYYVPKHFISISGMIYRMKQNAVGLANICILSAAVIVTISTTVSMYIGMEDVLRTRFPRNIIVNVPNVTEAQAAELDALIKKQTDRFGIQQKDPARYRTMGIAAVQNGTDFKSEDFKIYETKNFAFLTFLTLDDYNQLEGEHKTLKDGETLLHTSDGIISGNAVSFNGYKLKISERLPPLSSVGKDASIISNNYFFVVKDIDTIRQIYSSLNPKDPKAVNLSYFYGFDVDAGKDVQVDITSALKKELKLTNIKDAYAEGAESSRSSFFRLYGSLFFIGIFLGLLFVMATVLIIYYKQVAEGYDDKQRFEIMQKVGMSRAEVRKAIQSQVLSVFFLPLVTTVIHIAFAFKVITKLLAVLNLTNVPLFAVCVASTILVFAVLYTLVYLLTARTYYKIVS